MKSFGHLGVKVKGEMGAQSSTAFYAMSWMDMGVYTD